MIIRLRNSIHSRAFKVILWIVLFAASGALSVFEFMRSSFFGITKDWVLQINKHKILLPQFTRAVQNTEEQIRMMRSQYGQYADLYFQMLGLSMDPVELAISDLTKKALLNQEADKLPLAVDPEVARTYVSDPTFIQQELSDTIPLFAWDPSLQTINPVILNTYLHRTGMSMADFDRMVAQAVKRQDLRSLVELGSSTPSFELKEQFARNYLGHKFTVYTISTPSILEQVKKEPVSDEMLRSYFDLANRQNNQYRVPEKRSAKTFTFTPAQYGIEVPSDEIEKYYDTNKAAFIEQPVQIQVRRILLPVSNTADEADVQSKADTLQADLVKNPSSFAQRAKELSGDSATAAKGGLMDYFAKGAHEKEFEKTAFLLKQDGDISKVIRTKDGYEIVQRVGKKAPVIKPLTSVTNDIKATLQAKKFAERFAKDVRTVIADKQLLAQFVKAHNGTEETKKDIGANDTILAKTVFKLKNNESSFYQTGKEGVIVTVIDSQESYVPNFEAVKSQVKTDYYADAARKKTEEIIKKAAQDASVYEKFPGKTVEHTSWLVQRTDDKAQQAEKQKLMAKGIDSSRLFQIENIGSVLPIEAQGMVVIARLDERAPFDQELYNQHKEELMQQLKQQKKSLNMAGFVASLYRNATINKNESQIRSE